LIDDDTKAFLHRASISEQAGFERVEGLFKTGSATRIKLVARTLGQKKAEPLLISRISIREIPQP